MCDRPGEGVKSLGAKVISNCELHNMGEEIWGTIFKIKQQIPWTTELSHALRDLGYNSVYVYCL